MRIFAASIGMLAGLFLATAVDAGAVIGYFGTKKLYCDSPENLIAEVLSAEHAGFDGLFVNGCDTFAPHTAVLIETQDGIPVPNHPDLLIYRVKELRHGHPVRDVYVAFSIPAESSTN